MTVPHVEGADRVLTPPALAFIEALTRRFRPEIEELLAPARQAIALQSGRAP